MLFNGDTFKKKTDDIAKTILDLKPEQLHTEVYITVKSGKEYAQERRLNLIQGKKLFINEDFMDVFISNLMLA